MDIDIYAPTGDDSAAPKGNATFDNCEENRFLKYWETVKHKHGIGYEHDDAYNAAREAWFAAVTPSAAPQGEALSKPMQVEEWSYSTNGEDYKEQEGSRIEILAHAVHELEGWYDGQFYIGRNVRFVGNGFPMAETVIEGLQEQAYEECGEYAETYLDDVTKDEEKELGDFITAWAKRVDRSNFWTVTAVERHTIESAKEAIDAHYQQKGGES